METDRTQREPNRLPINKARIIEKKQNLKEFFAKDLEYVGLFVFAMTAAAMILFIVGFNLFASDEGAASYRHLRSAELLLTLAATGLVVAIVGRAQNPFVLAFGIFLIGALIVPSRDIVRFALIAFGSDKDYESFFQSATSGTDLAGRSTDVASKILTELSQAGFMATLDPAPRKQAIRIVAAEVRKEREITLLEQVGARGALDTLQATASDIEGWVYKYGKKDKFNEDLRYLRSEGLVSFAYDDLDTINITSLGRDVLGRAATGPFRATVPVAARGADRIYDQSTSRQFDCPTDISRLQNVSNELLSSGGRLMKLELETNYIGFVVPETSNYRFDVEVDDPEDKTTDPVLMLYNLTPDKECIFLSEDDDGGGDLNSRLALRLEPGTYLIGTFTVGNEGDVRVSVKKSDD